MSLYSSIANGITSKLSAADKKVLKSSNIVAYLAFASGALIYPLSNAPTPRDANRPNPTHR